MNYPNFEVEKGGTIDNIIGVCYNFENVENPDPDGDTTFNVGTITFPKRSLDIVLEVINSHSELLGEVNKMLSEAYLKVLKSEGVPEDKILEAKIGIGLIER